MTKRDNKNKDLGDPRRSRQPESDKIRTTDVTEKGDSKRPFKRRGKPSKK